MVWFLNEASEKGLPKYEKNERNDEENLFSSS